MDLSLFQTVVLGIVEGLTEFLPVSSTGHMIIAQKLLGIESTEFVKAFTVMIQLGAILSVVVLYWRKFFVLKEPESGVSPFMAFLSRFKFYWILVVGVLPAVVLGLLLNKYIDELLGSVAVVAVMLFLGGVFMLFIDRLFSKSQSTYLTYRKSFIIGIFQCLAMIPGVSRSMATIAGGMSQGLTRKAAAEFSFFLAVPTMFGATCLELYKSLKDGSGAVLLQGNNLSMLLIGNVVAFVVGMVAIKFFIDFLTKHGFAAFGWYRIIIGLVIIACLLMNVNLQMVG